jgi:hypothetical protein
MSRQNMSALGHGPCGRWKPISRSFASNMEVGEEHQQTSANALGKRSLRGDVTQPGPPASVELTEHDLGSEPLRETRGGIL